MKERFLRHWFDLTLPSESLQKYSFHNAEDKNSTFNTAAIPPASATSLSTINRISIPGTKNEIPVGTEGIRGNGGICFKTEQKKFA